jgi:hypothetical protein
MSRAVIAVSAALVLLLISVSAGKVQACTCVSAEPFDEAKTFRESRRRAALVFAGRVLSLQTTHETSYLGAAVDMNHTVATFAVYRLWKGPKAERVKVHFRSSAQSALCEYPFEADTGYLVFAYGKEPTAAACDYTRRLVDKEAPPIDARLGTPAWERDR